MSRALSLPLVGTLLLAILGLSACNTAIAESQPLVIAGLFNLSGDMSAYDSPANQGVQLAIKQQNAAGGIHGRPIKYTAQDTETQPAKIASATSEAIRQGATVLIGFNDPDSVLTAG